MKWLNRSSVLRDEKHENINNHLCIYLIKEKNIKCRQYHILINLKASFKRPCLCVVQWSMEETGQWSV